MAIEQFDELEQRHGFLSGQRKDLVEAIAQTGEAIKRIDRRRASASSRGVRRHQHQLRRDVHDALRRRPGRPRDARRERSARERHRHHRAAAGQAPPERAVAVGRREGPDGDGADVLDLQVPPSPFCLLDEIDAPLDDANIGRFVEMLRGMQDRTQFILITHHRKTMEIADRLYGVTMEEPGVSKVLRLDLTH
jgi:chromosome segregation protein